MEKRAPSAAAPLPAEGEDVASPPCPFCDGTETEVISPFGGQLSVSQCWCHRCRTGFDYLKWEAHPAGPGQA